MSCLCKAGCFSYGESPRTPPLEGTSLHRRNISVERPLGILSLFTTCLPLWVKSSNQSRCHTSPTQELIASILRVRWVKCCLMSSDVSWHIRDKLWPMPKHGSISNSLLPRKPEGSLGRTAQDVYLDSHTAPELWGVWMMMMSWCLMSSDVIWHIRDKLWPMPKHGSIKSTYVRCMRV